MKWEDLAQEPCSVARSVAVIGDRWVVSSGLKAGDRIVVEGLQHARPGEQVDVDDSPASGPLVKE